VLLFLLPMSSFPQTRSSRHSKSCAWHVFALLIPLLALSACGSSSKVAPATTTNDPPAAVTPHVVMVMEENHSYSNVAKNTKDWPNLNKLIASGALPTNYYANAHNSIPNYFMLTTGQLLTHDDGSTKVWNVDNLARRMLSSGVTFKIYAEGITQGYLGGSTGLYALNHNPFAMLSDIASNPQVAMKVMCPFSQFATDVANNSLPEFSFIIPNLDDDAHSAAPPIADTWLQTNIVTPLTGYSAFQSGGDGVLIIDFDESLDSDTANGGGHVAPVFWGPSVKPGYTQTSTTLYQHQSMLRTVMEILGLSNPPAAAATAPSMSEFFQQPK
jgi:acid phosphatase